MTFAGALLGVLAAALAASAVGWSLSRFFTGGLTRPEKVAWSFAAGLLVQAILFLIVVSIRPGHALIPLLVSDAVLVTASLLAHRPASTPLPRVPGAGRPLVVALLAVAAIAWLIFLVSALSEPMWATDYLAIWGLKGKAIATTGHVPGRLFADPALYWAHREYPLLVPFSLAMLASFAGGWHDQALALFYPLCELTTLCALYGFLSRRVSPLAGATAAALTALCFPLYRTVNAGTAEVPFSFSVVLVSTTFLDAPSDRSREVIARLAAASLLCVSIKQEGTLFVLILAAALWVRRRWEGWIPLASALLHWSTLRLFRGHAASRDFDLTFLEPRRWDELARNLGRVVPEVGAKALAAWLPVLAIVFFLFVTRSGIGDPLLPVLAAQIACIGFAFSISSFGPAYAVESAFARLTTTLFPALTLVLAARLEEPRLTSSARSWSTGFGESVHAGVRPPVESSGGDSGSGG